MLLRRCIRAPWSKRGAIFHTKCGSIQQFPAILNLPRRLPSIAYYPLIPEKLCPTSYSLPFYSKAGFLGFRYTRQGARGGPSKRRRLNGETATKTTTKTASTKGNETPRVKHTKDIGRRITA